MYNHSHLWVLSSTQKNSRLMPEWSQYPHAMIYMLVCIKVGKVWRPHIRRHDLHAGLHAARKIKTSIAWYRDLNASLHDVGKIQRSLSWLIPERPEDPCLTPCHTCRSAWCLKDLRIPDAVFLLPCPHNVGKIRRSHPWRHVLHDGMHGSIHISIK